MNALITSKPYQALFTAPSYAQGPVANALGRAAESELGQLIARQAPANYLMSR
jgi:hypothetical protein